MSKVREDTRTYGATMVESRGVHPISDDGRVARNDCRAPEAVLQEHVIHY